MLRCLLLHAKALQKNMVGSNTYRTGEEGVLRLTLTLRPTGLLIWNWTQLLVLLLCLAGLILSVVSR